MSQPPNRAFLDDRLAYWAEVKPDEPAITFLNRTFTWAELNERVRRAAGALADRGIGRGDVIAFLDKNHPACVETTLAAASLGAATAIINFRLAGNEMDYVLNDSGAKLLIVGAELKGGIDAIRDRLPGVEHIISVTPGGEGDEYEATLAAATPRGRGADVSPDDVCVIMYLGTTGKPRGAAEPGRPDCPHPQRRHLRVPTGRQVMVPHAAVPRRRNLVRAVPHPQRRTEHRDPRGRRRRDGRRIDGRGHPHLHGAGRARQGDGDGAGRRRPVPPAAHLRLRRLADAPGAVGQGARGVSGHRLRPGLRPDRGVRRGHPTVPGGPPRPPPTPSASRAPGSRAGQVEVKVVNPDTLEEVPVDQPGELWFRTPQVMEGYHNKPEATAEVITEDGWFRTGDIGRVDEDGFVFVEDRLKDMIISGGENIYSVEVERALTDHPAVLDAAVFGIPDEKWGESVKAVVELSAGQQVTPEELIAWCRDRLAHYKCPRSIDIMTELPRNPTGKLLKKDLRKPYWENRDRAI